jgi:hypothetical protein
MLRFWLVAIALAIGGMVFAPWYIFFAVLPLLHAPFQAFTLWYSIFFVFDFVRALSMSQLEIYLMVSLLGIAAALAAWFWSRPNRVLRGLLLLSLLAILAFPWLFRYQPALVAAPGHTMRLPTQPGWLDGVVKSNQISAEIRPCTYTLLGWSKDAVLYYQAACKAAPPQLWAIAPDREESARPVDSAPLELGVQKAPVSISDWVRADGVWPPSAEPNARRLNLREGSLISPDGRWVALIARHAYGPEDVVLLSPARQVN